MERCGMTKGGSVCRVSGRSLSLCLGAVALIFLSSGLQAGEKLTAGFGENGLTSLKWGGADILGEGKPEVSYVILEKMTVEANEKAKTLCAPSSTGFNRYAFEKIEGKDPRVSSKAAGKELKYSYAWGSVTFAYTPGPDRLGIAVTINNTSTRTIANFDIRPVKLLLPVAFEKPHKWWRSQVTMPGGFGMRAARYGDRKALFCCETVMPLRFGFNRPTDKNRGLQMSMRGGVNMLEPGGVVFYHHGLPRIGPGKEVTIKTSLRFTSAKTDDAKCVTDMIESFRKYHQPRLVWKDRRSIGAIFMSSGKGPPNNPRNWFKDKKIDIATAEGKTLLRQKAMKFADRCIGVLKGMNAQGAVIWDVEGSENPHPITYIGDPRMVKILAPEMEDIYPDFFKRFVDAGLRIGVCLRPTQVYHHKQKKKWAHGTCSHGPERNPLKDDFSKVWPKGLPWWRFYPVVERMSKKIEYAKKKWGCTLFYIDTNGVNHEAGEKKKFRWSLLDCHIWRDLHKRHPDVLLIPEFARSDGQLAYTSVYLQPPHSNAITRDFTRTLLPGAFSVSYTVNLKQADWQKRRPHLLKGIRAGDSMFFRGWFGCGYNKKIKAMYDEVYKPGAISPGLAEGPGETKKKM